MTATAASAAPPSVPVAAAARSASTFSDLRKRSPAAVASAVSFRPRAPAVDAAAMRPSGTPAAAAAASALPSPPSPATPAPATAATTDKDAGEGGDLPGRAAAVSPLRPPPPPSFTSLAAAVSRSKEHRLAGDVTAALDLLRSVSAGRSSYGAAVVELAVVLSQAVREAVSVLGGAGLPAAMGHLRELARLVGGAAAVGFPREEDAPCTGVPTSTPVAASTVADTPFPDGSGGGMRRRWHPRRRAPVKPVVVTVGLASAADVLAAARRTRRPATRVAAMEVAAAMAAAADAGTTPWAVARGRGKWSPAAAAAALRTAAEVGGAAAAADRWDRLWRLEGPSGGGRSGEGEGIGRKDAVAAAVAAAASAAAAAMVVRAGGGLAPAGVPPSAGLARSYAATLGAVGASDAVEAGATAVPSAAAAGVGGVVANGVGGDPRVRFRAHLASGRVAAAERIFWEELGGWGGTGSHVGGSVSLPVGWGGRGAPGEHEGRGLPERDAAWAATALLRAYADAGLVDKAEALLDRMAEGRLLGPPTPEAYAHVLTAVARAVPVGVAVGADGGGSAAAFDEGGRNGGGGGGDWERAAAGGPSDGPSSPPSTSLTAAATTARLRDSLRRMAAAGIPADAPVTDAVLTGLVAAGAAAGATALFSAPTTQRSATTYAIMAAGAAASGHPAAIDWLAADAAARGVPLPLAFTAAEMAAAAAGPGGTAAAFAVAARAGLGDGVSGGGGSGGLEAADDVRAALVRVLGGLGRLDDAYDAFLLGREGQVGVWETWGRAPPFAYPAGGGEPLGGGVVEGVPLPRELLWWLLFDEEPDVVGGERGGVPTAWPVAWLPPLPCNGGTAARTIADELPSVHTAAAAAVSRARLNELLPIAAASPSPPDGLRHAPLSATALGTGASLPALATVTAAAGHPAAAAALLSHPATGGPSPATAGGWAAVARSAARKGDLQGAAAAVAATIRGGVVPPGGAAAWANSLLAAALGGAGGAKTTADANATAAEALLGGMRDHASWPGGEDGLLLSASDVGAGSTGGAPTNGADGGDGADDAEAEATPLAALLPSLSGGWLPPPTAATYTAATAAAARWVVAAAATSTAPAPGIAATRAAAGAGVATPASTTTAAAAAAVERLARLCRAALDDSGVDAAVAAAGVVVAAATATAAAPTAARVAGLAELAARARSAAGGEGEGRAAATRVRGGRWEGHGGLRGVQGAGKAPTKEPPPAESAVA
ncbi:hypothetical protein MMPV_003871 [Pyropia vietnamensis]